MHQIVKEAERVWRAADLLKRLRQKHSEFCSRSYFRDPGWSTVSTLDNVVKCVSFYSGLVTNHYGDTLALTKPPSFLGPLLASCAGMEGHVIECDQGRWLQRQRPVLDRKAIVLWNTTRHRHKTMLFSCPGSGDATVDSAHGRDLRLAGRWVGWGKCDKDRSGT